MYQGTVVTEAEWRQAFDQWEHELNIRQLARVMHVDEKRIRRTLEAIDPERYARVARAHGRQRHQAPARERKTRRPTHHHVQRATSTAVKGYPPWLMAPRETKPQPTPKRRECLRCDRTFLSEAPDIRLCAACRAALLSSPTPEPEYTIAASINRRR